MYFYDSICKFKRLKLHRIKINGYNASIYKMYSTCVCVSKFHRTLSFFKIPYTNVGTGNHRNKMSSIKYTVIMCQFETSIKQQ